MVKVKPGEEGRVAFIQDVRRLLRLRDNQEFSITFECKVPGHGASAASSTGTFPAAAQIPAILLEFSLQPLLHERCRNVPFAMHINPEHRIFPRHRSKRRTSSH